jgi:hypothetical protein
MIKFFRGPAKSFDKVLHKDGLYFAIDKGEIYLNDSVYGSDETVTDVEMSEDGTSLIVHRKGQDDKVINLVDLMAKASSVAAGLMAAEDKIALDTLYTAYTNDELGKVQGVAEGDKFLSMSDKLISATIDLKYTDKKIQLLGIGNEVIAEIDAADFIKDSVLEDVEIVTEDGVKYIEFTWAVAEGETAKTDRIAVADLASEYVAGLGITISDADEIAVKVASHKTNFLEVDENGLGVYSVNANAAVLQKDITVAGLSGKLGTGNYENGDVIPAGTSIYTILENLLSQELYPTAAKVSQSANLTSSFAAPSFTLTNSDKIVEVGTGATVSEEKGYEPIANKTSRTYSGFTNGYATEVGGTVTSGNPSSVGITEVSLNEGTFKLTRTYSGFGLSGDDLIASSENAVAANCSIAEDSTLVVAEGENKVTFKMEGPGHSGKAVSSPAYYYASNLGNTIAAKVVAAKDEQTFDIETATAGSATLTVTGARYMFWGSHADYETLDSAKIRAHANGGAAASAAQTVEITIPESGVKQFYVALPSGRSLTKIYNTAAGESFGDITASFTVDTTPITVAVEGANGYTAANYTVYYFNSGTSWVGPNTLTVIIG